MEVSAPKIYDIQLVINSIEVEGNVAKVLCVECCGTRMFLGTAEGYLLEYFITDQKSKTFFNRVRLVNINKGQPIVQIRNASALDTLITLSGGTLAMCDSQTMEPKGSSISSVSCFAVDDNPIDGDPFSVSLCFVKKKSIIVAQASETGFNIVKDISLDALTISLAIESGLCCVGLATGKYIIVNTMAQRKTMQDLCEFDPKEVLPKVVHVGKEEFLVIGPGGLGVFVTSRGTSERPPIIWSEKIHQLVVDGLNVVAVGNDSIYVSSLSDPGNSNLIPFPGAKCLSLSEGKLYVGTARSLYRFIPISVDEQVEALLSADKIDQAFTLLEMAHLKADRKENLFRKIHKRAVFHRMAEFELSLCKESIGLSHIDLREILNLFPGILPTTTIFTRTLPQLHSYADINQMTNRDSHKNRTLASFLLDILTFYEPMYDSKDLSTSTIKLAAKFNKSKYILLLDDIDRMTVDYDDVFEWMEEEKMFDSAALLHKAKRDLHRALDTWIRLLTGELKCGDNDEFEGIDAIVDALLSSNEEQLVWNYYYKLAKIDPDKAIQVFTKRNPSPAFQPLEIAEKLSSQPRVCRTYLSHFVTIKNFEDPDLHTFLATLYIDEILGNPEMEDLQSVREQFRMFLISSNCLKVQYLIGKLSTSTLRLELAILHGKAGDHAPALKIIVEELQDHSFAREYCKNIQDRLQREQAFISLFKSYSPQSEEPELSPECLNVLADFVEDFDISLILPILPDDLNLTIISNVLRRAVRLKIHKMRQTKLIKGLSQRVNVDYQLELDSRNQGYQVDDESVCGVCWRKFDSLEPLLHNKGQVVHSKCV